MVFWDFLLLCGVLCVWQKHEEERQDFVDRGCVSVVGLAQLVKAGKLSGTQGRAPACVGEAIGLKAEYKAERD